MAEKVVLLYGRVRVTGAVAARAFHILAAKEFYFSCIGQHGETN